MARPLLYDGDMNHLDVASRSRVMVLCLAIGCGGQPLSMAPDAGDLQPDAMAQDAPLKRRAAMYAKRLPA